MTKHIIHVRLFYDYLGMLLKGSCGLGRRGRVDDGKGYGIEGTTSSLYLALPFEGNWF